MDRAFQRLDDHVGGDPTVETDTGTEVETDDSFVSAEDPGTQNHYETVRWILHLQREGFYFQRKSETRDVVDGYRALVKAGVCDQSLESYLDEIWANAREDVEDFYAADGGDEAPSQGASRGWVFRA